MQNEKVDELWDLYDKDRKLTGKTHRRGDKMQSGQYHLVVHVCIFNSKNELLIQQRQPFKKGWSNLWDLSVGGSAVARDNSQMAAERETLEELGIEIDLSNIRPHFTINFENGFDDYYLVEKDIDIKELKLQKEEVKNAKWVSKEEVLKMVDDGLMVPYYFLEDLFDVRKKYGSVLIQKDNINVTYATMQNLESWINMVEIVRDEFPGLETQELLDQYRDTVIDCINKGNAICALNKNRVVGTLLFSIEESMVGFIAVHPNFRKMKIATNMMNLMLERIDPTKDVTVETFREDDEKGTAPRAMYKKLGFVEDELGISENYQVQKFILKSDAE